MPDDAHTFNACGEMMSGCKDSLMLKLALQPVDDQLLKRLGATDFVRRPIANLAATLLRPL